MAVLVEKLLADHDVFVACGGDGTIREVASKIIGKNKTLGIIPMGSGNDLCKTLGIPQNVPQSLEIVLKGNTAMMDVGQCNDEIFLNTLGFGFDGLTNRYALEMKNIHPFFRYLIAALKAAVHQDAFKVKISKGESVHRQRAIMISLANGRVEGGSFWIAPEASITDGRFTMVLIEPVKKWKIPLLLPLFLFGRADCISNVQKTETGDISLEFESNVEIHADGEIIKNNTDKYDIKLIPNSLEVLSGL